MSAVKVTHVGRYFNNETRLTSQTKNEWFFTRVLYTNNYNSTTASLNTYCSLICTDFSFKIIIKKKIINHKKNKDCFERLFIVNNLYTYLGTYIDCVLKKIYENQMYILYTGIQ